MGFEDIIAMRETKTTRSEPLVHSQYDHLIPHASRLLVVTAKVGWRVMKGLVRFAVRLPGIFVRANTQNASSQNANSRKETHI
jgi:hypothetical protein